MKKKLAFTLYATVAESTGNTQYFTGGGDNESMWLAFKMCPKLAESTDALSAWLDSHGDQPPSWFYKTVGGPVHTKHDMAELLKKVK
jgi:hypothetical protein